MKTMNYLFTAVFVLILSSCTSEDQTDEVVLESTELQSSAQQEGFLNGLELYKWALAQNINVLKQDMLKLQQGIDGGKKHLLPEWEVARKKLLALEKYKVDLVGFVMPKGFPPPLPRGCWEPESSRCMVDINVAEFKYIHLTKGLDDSDILFRNKDNDIVGRTGKIFYNENGLRVMAIETDFEGEATMFIRPRNELFSEDMALTIKVYND